VTGDAATILPDGGTVISQKQNDGQIQAGVKVADLFV